MLRLKLARELSADGTETRVDWPLAIDRSTHELCDQCLASCPLGLEVILALRDGALVRRRRLGPWHVEQKQLHDRRWYRAFLRLERSFAERSAEKLVHVPEHLIDA